MIGKRKREAVVVRRESRDDEDEEQKSSHDILRQYFEARFEPIPQLQAAVPASESQEEDDSENASEEEAEWDGLSDDDDDDDDDDDLQTPVVQVIEYTKPDVAGTSPDGSKRAGDFKSFMSSKPPREIQPTSKTNNPNNPPSSDEEGETETLNLKHDLDLQRLLRESHLLDTGNKSTSNSNDSPSGTQRHKATDLRIQNLDYRAQHSGAAFSLFDQEKMPMAHRRGISGKAALKDEKRRRDAKENGIVLEKKVAAKQAQSASKRTRGVDAPGAGKFRGGTLKLSSRDIKGIQGSGGPGQRTGRRRR